MRRGSLSDDFYERVVRPCFKYRLLEAAKQENRAHRTRKDVSKLASNWSHDVVLAQYARIAQRMEDRQLANVQEVMPEVRISLFKYRDTVRAPGKDQQLRNRKDAFSKPYRSDEQALDLEAESSRKTYGGLKNIAKRVKKNI